MEYLKKVYKKKLKPERILNFFKPCIIPSKVKYITDIQIPISIISIRREKKLLIINFIRNKPIKKIIIDVNIENLTL